MRIALATLLLCLVLPACRAQAPASPAAPAAPAAASGAAPSTAPAAAESAVAMIASGLEHPWAVAPLPDGRFLVTERPGRMRYVSATGEVSAPLDGVPEVWANGQAG